MRRLLRWSPVLLSLCALAACSRYWTARFSSPTAADVDQSAPFVKCHLPSGDVYVLTEWSLSDTEIRGRGLHYDVDRHQSSPTPTEHVLSLSDIALLETNRPENFMHGTVAVLGVATAASLAVTAVCATNPKTCFGSCPTFYALSEAIAPASGFTPAIAGPDASDGKGGPLMAEGFSASVARSMEETDVDALVGARLTPDGFLLEMRNEALETHFVQSLRIGVVHSEGRRVLREGDRYRPARALHEPLRCQAWSGGPEQAPTDCLERVRVADGAEYVSETDGHDLAAREEIRLRFRHPPGALGIEVRARNTLLNTFLFYQGLAYMGRSMGDYLMLLEAHAWAVEGTRAFLRTLGGIDAEVKTRAGWRPIGSFEEIGPIARDVQLWSLPADLPEGDIEIRLTLSRGNYKIDELLLAELLPAVSPTWYLPDRARKDGRDAPAALASLLDPERRLMTFPGERYELHFPVPEQRGAPPQLFLESRGYYYEWGRESWLPEEDPEKVLLLFRRPRAALVELAAAYQRIERDMDAMFWGSRVGEAP